MNRASHTADEQLGFGHHEYYQRHYGTRPPEAYTWLLAQIITHGKPGSVLDLGCGTGLFVELASKWGLDVAGCDGAADAIRLAQQRNSQLRVEHGVLSGRLPFAEASIDN